MPVEKKGGTVEVVERIVQPIIQEMGLTLWDVRYEKEGSAWYLRIYIDKPGGVDIEDCEKVSRAVDAPIEQADPIPGSYYLEVSSPGIERELVKPEHFKAYEGEKVTLRLIRPLEDGQRSFTGVLGRFSDGEITLLTPQGQMAFPKKQTAFVRLYADFEAGGEQE